mmetsp:Transcript_15887/g.55324  ORF Transcript_15887/g.55324 Transcript_15887/m.55324 type:complete len:210 (+) Transcript_15887:903-1532(+)
MRLAQNLLKRLAVRRLEGRGAAEVALHARLAPPVQRHERLDELGVVVLEARPLPTLALAAARRRVDVLLHAGEAGLDDVQPRVAHELEERVVSGRQLRHHGRGVAVVGREPRTVDLDARRPDVVVECKRARDVLRASTSIMSVAQHLREVFQHARQHRAAGPQQHLLLHHVDVRVARGAVQALRRRFRLALENALHVGQVLAHGRLGRL